MTLPCLPVVMHTLTECVRYTDEQDVIAEAMHEHMTDKYKYKYKYKIYL